MLNFKVYRLNFYPERGHIHLREKGGILKYDELPAKSLLMHRVFQWPQIHIVNKSDGNDMLGALMVKSLFDKI